MRKMYFMGVLLLALGAMFVLGCGGTKKVVVRDAASGEFAGAPAWVTKGRMGVDKSDQSKYLYGVGSMGGTRNIALARDGALGRARTDLARSLELKVKSMLKDYQSTTTGGGEFGTSAADEQKVDNAAKQMTDMTLSGTELADSWVSNNGNIWVLCRLDVESFKNSVNKMGQLSESVRKAVSERADKAWAELDE